jgi:hypothetical protein
VNFTDSAIIAVGGILVGALISGGLQALGARSSRARAARAAARILYLDLRNAEHAVRDLITSHAWDGLITDWSQFEDVWVRYQQPLATALGTDDFMYVSSAFQCINSVRLAHDTDLQTPGQFDPTDEILRDYVSRIRRAQRIVLLKSFETLDRFGRRGVRRAREISRQERSES